MDGGEYILKVIIHDLDADCEKPINSKYDTVILADGKYAHCQGCFNCWTKHPAECYLKDSLRYISRIVGQADELIIVTENCYGTYSPPIKTILDRSIGLSTPMCTYRKGQMHHTVRYGKHNVFKVYVYGEITEKEKDTFTYIKERNAINFGYLNFETVFCEKAESAEDLLR